MREQAKPEQRGRDPGVARQQHGGHRQDQHRIEQHRALARAVQIDAAGEQPGGQDAAAERAERGQRIDERDRQAELAL